MKIVYAALKWIADNAKDIGIDNTRICVAGASAGGGSTAALALLARDRNYPNHSFQMPLHFEVIRKVKGICVH